MGPERAVAFDTFLDGGIRPLTLGDLQHYAQRRKDLLDWMGSGRLDLVAASLRHIKVALQKLVTYEEARQFSCERSLRVVTCLQKLVTYEEARQNRTLWRNLARFLADLPADLREATQDWFGER